MSTNTKYLVLGTAIVGVTAAATLIAFAEDSTASWKITPSFSVNKVRLTLRHSSAHGNWRESRDVELDKFRGLSLSMLGTTGPAKFEYVADAGRLVCEGRFLLGSGSGDYTFQPDREFVAFLQKLGYDTPDDDQLFSMLMMDINREFAQGIRDAGLKASTTDLIQLRTHGVAISFIRAARQAGYESFTADDFAQLRIHGVEAALLRDLRDAGYNLRAGEISELAIHGVDSHYVRELKSLGLQPDSTDLVQFRIHGVEPDYLKSLKDAGYTNLRADEINQLRNHGVEGRFAQEARRLGYDFSPDDLAQLKIHGVDEAYLKRLKDSGMRNLNADQIAQLRIHGVD